MLPIILISKDLIKQEKYVDNFIHKHSISNYYVYKIAPVKTEITIDQIRAIKKEIITKNNTTRLFVCYSFDTANIEAQNAFLKTLEEKSEHNQFFLLVKNAERLLPTIRSRGVTTYLDKDLDTIHVSQNYQEFFNALSASKSFELLSNPLLQGITREDAEKFFDEFIVFTRNLARTKGSQYARVVKKILQTKSLLQNNNLNPQLAVDSTIIFFKQTIKLA